MLREGSRPTAVDAADVDLHALVRAVRLQRTARAVARLAVAALVGWFVAVVVGTGTTAQDSSTHAWFDGHGNRGFLVVLAVLAADLIAWALLRGAGRTGRVAARCIPLLRRTPDPVEVRKRATDRVLDLRGRSVRVPRSGRSRTAAVVVAVLLVLFGGLAVYTGLRVAPSYRAAHGHGGPIVTMGADSHITRRVSDQNYQGRAWDYYISSPLGEALAEGDGKPSNGTRFTIVHSGGRLRAIHLGGHSWVTDLVVAIVGGLLAAWMLALLVQRMLSRGPTRRVVPLHDTVATLSRGKPVALRIGTTDIPLSLGAGTAVGPGSVPRRRLVDLGLAAALLAVLAAVGVVAALV